MNPQVQSQTQSSRPRISVDEFAKLRELIHNIVGISLQGDRSELLRNRLLPRLKRLGLPSFAAYCDCVRHTEGERQHLINAVTTNVTSFFREQHQFDHLEKQAIERIFADNAETQKIRIWSAGCSSGEEPFSIAMTLLSAQIDLSGWDVRVLATDANSEMLAQAEAAQYHLETAPDGLLPRWLHPTNEKDWYTVDDRVRELVWFRCLNLLNDWPMRKRYDAVFCRNVTIYFDRDTQGKVMTKIVELLRPGGFLYLGHSESLLAHSHQFTNEGPGIYRKAQ